MNQRVRSSFPSHAEGMWGIPELVCRGGDEGGAVSAELEPRAALDFLSANWTVLFPLEPDGDTVITEDMIALQNHGFRWGVVTDGTLAPGLDHLLRRRHSPVLL